MEFSGRKRPLSFWALLCNVWLPCTLAMTISVPRSPVIITNHFHIRFDGCFRPPRDPGFATIPKRMAVCAACIGRVLPGTNSTTERKTNQNAKDFEERVVPLAVGARELPVSIETTSQHAEYEGLLMGLEWLVEFLSSQAVCTSVDKNEEPTPGVLLLTIEGDCKTVIDQLTGKSKPRKLEALHLRAEGILDELRRNVGTPGVDPKAENWFRAEFRHIPRNENSVSDGLCNSMMSILGAKSWIDSLGELAKFQDQIPSSSKPSPLALSTILEQSIERTKFSLRLALYESTAKLAVRTENYELLVQIGERIMEEESSLEGVKDHYGAKVSRSAEAPKVSGIKASLIRKTGVNYQIRGWEGLGKAKKIKFLQRKHRDLFSNNDGGDDDDCANYISKVGETMQFVPLIESEGGNGKVGLGSSIYQKLETMGDVTQGEWNRLTPDVWKPLLDKWFVSARYENSKEVEDDAFSPIWAVHGNT